MKDRIDQFDSIRGLAAFSVLLSHVSAVSATMPSIFLVLISYSPLNVLVNGHGAVMLFFVLSGFVLSLPILEGRYSGYFSYLVKRFFRIYIPYFFSIIIVFIITSNVQKVDVSLFSDWFNNFWSSKLDLNLYLEHINLLGNIHSDSLNPVIWSLIHEMRVSFVFPFIVMMVKRFNIWINLLICLILSFMAGLNPIFNIQTSNGHFTSYFDTIHYLSIFILGALLAKHRKILAGYYYKNSLIGKWSIVILSFILYNYSFLLDQAPFKSLINLYSYNNIISEYFIAVGACGFFVISLGSKRISKLLISRPLLFIGKISYSLYLYHFIVLLSMGILLYKLVPISLILFYSIITSIIVALIAWYLIEKSSEKVGKVLSKKISKKSITKIKLSA